MTDSSSSCLLCSMCVCVCVCIPAGMLSAQQLHLLVAIAPSIPWDIALTEMRRCRCSSVSDQASGHALPDNCSAMTMCRGPDSLDGPGLQPTWRVQLCLWCLSPAVAFAELQKTASSIVLTSGTLSPLDSMASEVCHHTCSC